MLAPLGRIFRDAVAIHDAVDREPSEGGWEMEISEDDEGTPAASEVLLSS